MAGPQLTDIAGIGPAVAAALRAGGFKTVDAVAKATPTALIAIRGIGAAKARTVVASAKRVAKAGGPVKAPARRAAAKQPTAKKAPAKKAAARKTIAKKAPAKKAAPKKAKAGDKAKKSKKSRKDDKKGKKKGKKK